MSTLLPILGLNAILIAWVAWLVIKDPANVWRGKPRHHKEKKKLRRPRLPGPTASPRLLPDAAAVKNIRHGVAR